MQKISSYLYPNRVEVEFDEHSSFTEWRIVYQRRIKIYRGVTNTIEFDFKNSYQRRVDVSNFAINCAISDEAGNNVAILPLENTTLKGISVLTIPSGVLAALTPQFLTYSLYIEDDYGVKTIVYADTQFGAEGHMELITTAYPFVHHVATFTQDTDGSFYCDPIPFEMIDDQIIDLSHFRLNFDITTCNATVSVLAVNAMTVDVNTQWIELERFDINETIPAISKEYVETRDFNTNIGWVQIRYYPHTNNTGTIDTVSVIA